MCRSATIGSAKNFLPNDFIFNHSWFTGVDPDYTTTPSSISPARTMTTYNKLTFKMKLIDLNLGWNTHAYLIKFIFERVYPLSNLFNRADSGLVFKVISMLWNQKRHLLDLTVKAHPAQFDCLLVCDFVRVLTLATVYARQFIFTLNSL